MEKKYYHLTVLCPKCYSLVIYCKAKDENEALQIAAINHVFLDDDDILYATCKEADENRLDPNLVIEL